MPGYAEGSTGAMQSPLTVAAFSKAIISGVAAGAGTQFVLNRTGPIVVRGSQIMDVRWVHALTVAVASYLANWATPYLSSKLDPKDVVPFKAEALVGAASAAINAFFVQEAGGSNLLYFGLGALSEFIGKWTVDRVLVKGLDLKLFK